DVIIFCAEVAGVAAFRLLRDKANELQVLKDDPAALARVNALFQQILVDEVGHVHYVRSRLGPARLGVAKAILPLFTRVFLGGGPALTRLFGRERLLKEVLRADIDGASASYPDRFLPAGR